MTSTTTPKQIQQFNVPKGPTTSAAVISELWLRASENMSHEEIKWLCHASEEAGCMTANLRHVVEGIAGLVGTDSQAGNFQRKDDVAILLYFIGQYLSSIEAMSEIGSEAEYRMRAPVN